MSRFRHSLVLRVLACVVLFALLCAWVVSSRYVLYAAPGGGAGTSRTGVAFASGALVIQHWDSLPATRAKAGAVAVSQTLYQRRGMCWLPFHESSRLVGSMWHVPLWIFLIPACFATWKAWRRAYAPGLCAACGYDKTGLASKR